MFLPVGVNIYFTDFALTALPDGLAQLISSLLQRFTVFYWSIVQLSVSI